jgi:anaerobic dimethyl sulfoxide reductase subunit A
MFNKLAGAKVAISKTESELLCTITQDDIDEWGVDGVPQQGRIPLKQLVEQGIYQVERKPGDELGYIAFEDFRKDPVKHPTPYSESGKFEIYSRKLADTINGMGYGGIQPIPTYIEPLEGYEQTFSDWKNKIKGEYPYQVITLKPLGRAHTVFDNVGWLREAFRSPVYISAIDARKEGIVNGDTVMLISKIGKTLRTAITTQRLMPGCVVMFHGRWSDFDEKTGIDTNGSDNIICGDTTTGQGTTGTGSLLVSIRKYSDKRLTPDLEKSVRTYAVGEK